MPLKETCKECTEIAVLLSSWQRFVLLSPTPHCLCLLLPSFVTHFMTSRLRVTGSTHPEGEMGACRVCSERECQGVRGCSVMVPLHG